MSKIKFDKIPFRVDNFDHRGFRFGQGTVSRYRDDTDGTSPHIFSKIEFGVDHFSSTLTPFPASKGNPHGIAMEEGSPAYDWFLVQFPHAIAVPASHTGNGMRAEHNFMKDQKGAALVLHFGEKKWGFYHHAKCYWLVDDAVLAKKIQLLNRAITDGQVVIHGYHDMGYWVFMDYYPNPVAVPGATTDFCEVIVAALEKGLVGKVMVDLTNWTFLLSNKEDEETLLTAM